MRRLNSVLLAGLTAAVLVVGVSGPSAATPTPFSKATLTVVLGTLPPSTIPSSGLGATGNVDIVRSGNAIVGVNVFPPGKVGTGILGNKTTMMTISGTVTNCIPAAGGHAGCGGGLVVPVTDPAAAPIRGLQFTEANATGNWALATPTAMQPQPVTPGAHLRGPMQLLGVNKVCLFGPCNAGPPANITVPVSPVGVGGTVSASGAVAVTVKGAPWTTGKLVIFPRTAMTTMGAAVTPPGNPTGMGMTTMGGTSMATVFAAGGVTNMAQTSMGGAGTQIQLVTPIFVSTNIPASAVVPAYAIFQFVVPSPEPGVAAAGVAVIGTLLILGWRRRRSH